MLKKRKSLKVTNWKYQLSRALIVRNNIANRTICTIGMKSILSTSYIAFFFNKSVLNVVNWHQLGIFKRVTNASLARNLCIGTGRSSSHYRLFNANRMWLKTMAEYGYLPGIRRAAW